MGNKIEAVSALSMRNLPPLVPLAKRPPQLAPVTEDTYLEVNPPRIPSSGGDSPKSKWISREQLETTFPGVLFRGALIFVEEGTLIAPGVIVDTEDNLDSARFGRIEIRSDSAIATGTVLRGNVTVVKGRLRSGSFVGGVVNLTETTLGRGAKIVGENIVCYQAVVLGSISGDTISVNEATITSQGSLIGSNIVVYPDEVIAGVEVGSDRRLGRLSNVGEQKTLAVKP